MGETRTTHEDDDGTFKSMGMASGINDRDGMTDRVKAGQNLGWADIDIDIDGDGDGNLLIGDAATPAASTATVATPPRSTAVADLATLFVKNDLVELASDSGVEDLTRALEKALEAKSPRARKNAVLRVFDEDPCVAEVFADDEQLEEIACSLV